MQFSQKYDENLLLKMRYNFLKINEKSSAGVYGYGFNGMEKDDEVKGEGNSYNFGARMYDSRLGRWLCIDQEFMHYPSNSNYSFGLNCPLIFIDPTGKVVVNINSASAQFIKARLEKTDAGKVIWQQMVESKNKITIHVLHFKDEKENGFKEQGGYSKLAAEMQTAGGFVGRTEIVNKLAKGENVGVLDQKSGGEFNPNTGEYEFTEGVDLVMVIDFDLIDWAAQEQGLEKEKFRMEVIVEEAVHTIQDYLDLGIHFKKKKENGTAYEELSDEALKRKEKELMSSPKKAIENYKSQRNEIEAKAKASEVVGEYENIED